MPPLMSWFSEILWNYVVCAWAGKMLRRKAAHKCAVSADSSRGLPRSWLVPLGTEMTAWPGARLSETEGESFWCERHRSPRKRGKLLPCVWEQRQINQIWIQIQMWRHLGVRGTHSVTFLQQSFPPATGPGSRAGWTSRSLLFLLNLCNN